MRNQTNQLHAPMFVQPPRHPQNYAPTPPCSAAFAFPEVTPALPVALPVNAGSDEEWLREEKERLETYLTNHLDLLRQQREEFARSRSEAEADLLTREMKLNRQLKSAERRERALTLREAALDARSDRKSAVEEDILQLSKFQEQVQRDLDTQKEILEQLFQEVNLVRDRARVAKKDFDSLRKASRKAHAEQKEWQSRRTLLEHRENALQQAEEALQRRIAENEELEEQLRGELDRREQELIIENRELEHRRRELALESLDKDYLRR